MATHDVPSDPAHCGADAVLQSSGRLPTAAAEALTFELALEEVFMTSSCTARLQHALRMRCRWNDRLGLTMTVEDDGPDQSALVAPPDVTASLGERAVGGRAVLCGK